jgi:hypothetical protein
MAASFQNEDLNLSSSGDRERSPGRLTLTGSASSAPGPGRSPADPDRDAKLDRIEYVTGHDPDRCFAFDQFGPLSIRPVHGSAWAERQRPVRLPATYHQIHGVRCFRGCSVGDDQLWARGRTGGHGVIGAQTGGRGTGTPASAPARDFTGAIGPPGARP